MNTKNTITIGQYTFRPYPDRPEMTLEQKESNRKAVEQQNLYDLECKKMRYQYDAEKKAEKKAKLAYKEAVSVWKAENLKISRELAKQIKKLIKNPSFKIEDEKTFHLFNKQNDLFHSANKVFGFNFDSYLAEFLNFETLNDLCEYNDKCFTLLEGYNYNI